MECNNQYGRRNNVEISGIPNNVADSELEKKVIDIYKKLDVEIVENDIEACHRLPPPRNNQNATKKVIVRFVNRKKCEKALKNKKKLDSVEMESLNFSEETKLSVSENFNRYFNKLAWICRQLKRKNFVSSFTYGNEAFNIKFKKGNREINKKINCEKQLKNLFPDFFRNEDKHIEG